MPRLLPHLGLAKPASLPPGRLAEAAVWLGPLCGVLGGIVFILCAQVSPWLGLALLVGVLGFALLVFFPVLGLYLTALVVPLERVGRFTDDTSLFTISLMRAFGAAAFGAMAVHYLLAKRVFLTGPAFGLYAGYCVFVVLSLTYTGDYEGTIRQLTPMLGNLMFFFILVNLVQTRQHADLAAACWLAASVGACLFSIYDWHFGSGTTGGVTPIGVAGEIRESDKFSTVLVDSAEWRTLSGLSLRRSMGTSSHPALYGINLIMTLPYWLYFIRFAKSLAAQFFLVLCFLLVLYNILLTNTRAVFVITAASLALAVGMGLLRLRRGYIVALLVGLVVLPFVVPADIYNRMLNPSTYSLDKAAAMRIRLDYWRASIEILSDYWLTGVGSGNRFELPKYVLDPMTPKETSVHNIYIQTMLDVGIFGWLLFFSFVGLVLRYALNASKWFKQARLEREHYFCVAGVVLMLSVLLFGVQADVFLFPLKGWWLISGIIVVLYGIARREGQAHLRLSASPRLPDRRQPIAKQ